MINTRSHSSAIALAAAIGAGIMAFAFLAATRAADRRALKHQLAAVKNPITAVFASRNVAKGTLIRKEDIRYRQVPSAYLPAGFVRRKSRVIGKEAASEIFAGEVLLEKKISGSVGRRASMVISAGRVGLAIGTDEIAGVAGGIRPGDRVDILMTEPEGGRTRLFQADVRVLGVGGVFPFSQAESSAENSQAGAVGAATGATVVLELTSAQAGRLTEASENGKIRLALRGAI